VRDYADEHGIAYSDVSELNRHPQILELLQAEMDRRSARPRADLRTSAHLGVRRRAAGRPAVGPECARADSESRAWHENSVISA
jgi:hypothetical protein